MNISCWCLALAGVAIHPKRSTVTGFATWSESWASAYDCEMALLVGLELLSLRRLRIKVPQGAGYGGLGRGQMDRYGMEVQMMIWTIAASIMEDIGDMLNPYCCFLLISYVTVNASFYRRHTAFQLDITLKRCVVVR